MTHSHRFLIGILVVSIALAAALALMAFGEQISLAENDIIYVDVDAPGPTHDGSSWDFAYTSLQAALADAEAGQQIWVAAGTYKPTDSTDRTISFQMVNDVAIYGGFAGGETELGQRDWVANETILSGDIGEEGNTVDNSYHVFYHPGGLDDSAILDGFTITGGNANGGSWPHYVGAGMNNDGSSPTLTNCTFSGNSASFGGAMRNHSSSPTLTGCTFTGNSATYSGGGMYNTYYSAPALTNCTFEGNEAGYLYFGGGMYNDGSSPTLANCTFEGNSATYGGGMYNFLSSPTQLTNCTLSGNSATYGGGMYNDSSSPTLTNCSFSDNSAEYYGGAMRNYNSSPTLTNCTFYGNEAGEDGGGMHNASSSPTLTNGILWGDTAGGLPDEIYNASGTPVVTYSDIQGGYDGEGNIDADPLFLAALSGDLRLQLTSPAIDAGDNGAVPAAVTTDLDGNRRFADVPWVLDTGSGHPPIVDMGAYEIALEVIYVDRDAPGADNGTSWLNAFTNLQDGLDAAEAPAQIWVAAGVYTPTWKLDDGDPRSATFQMANGVVLYGGFDPSAGDVAWAHRDWEDNPTILSGDLADNDQPGFVNNEENSYHVFYHPLGTDLDASARLDGFTISGGNANVPDAHIYGGGMLNDGSSPTLVNLTFAANSARYGGGMSIGWSSSPALTNCIFEGNSANEWGGGIYIYSSSPTLTNCTFYDNSATDGGAIYNNNSSLTLVNCILWGDDSPELSNVGSGTPTITYSNIQDGGYASDGNIDANPLFVDPDNGDFHLGPGSPCIDAGSNTAPNLPDHDFEGDLRIVDGNRDGVPTVDMGVDEALLRVYLPLVLRGY